MTGHLVSFQWRMWGTPGSASTKVYSDRKYCQYERCCAESCTSVHIRRYSNKLHRHAARNRKRHVGHNIFKRIPGDTHLFSCGKMRLSRRRQMPSSGEAGGALRLMPLERLAARFRRGRWSFESDAAGIRREWSHEFAKSLDQILQLDIMLIQSRFEFGEL